MKAMFCCSLTFAIFFGFGSLGENNNSTEVSTPTEVVTNKNNNNKTIDADNGKPFLRSDHVIAVVSAVITLVILIAIIIIIVKYRKTCFNKHRMRRYHRPQTLPRNGAGNNTLILLESPISSRGSDSIAPLLPPPRNTLYGVSKSILVDGFRDACRQRMRNNFKILGEEFDELSQYDRKIPANNNLTALTMENRNKNRSRYVVPYDDGRRVKLRTCNSFDKSDYINASFIQIPNTAYPYIACQGPTVDTLVDFWSMIWDNEVKLVVMLTGLKEGGTDKCVKYWPETDQSMTVGSYTITNKGEERRSNYVKRTLWLNKNGFLKMVFQYHYLCWAELTFPDSPHPFLQMMKEVKIMFNNIEAKGYLLVHGSSGAGRTGTYITVDIIINKIKKNSSIIDIFETVLSLREQRPCMVQTQGQYGFIYKCIDVFLSEEKKAESEIYDDIGNTWEDTYMAAVRPYARNQASASTSTPERGTTASVMDQRDIIADDTNPEPIYGTTTILSEKERQKKYPNPQIASPNVVCDDEFVQVYSPPRASLQERTDVTPLSTTNSQLDHKPPKLPPKKRQNSQFASNFATLESFEDIIKV